MHVFNGFDEMGLPKDEIDRVRFFNFYSCQVHAAHLLWVQSKLYPDGVILRLVIQVRMVISLRSTTQSLRRIEGRESIGWMLAGCTARSMVAMAWIVSGGLSIIVVGVCGQALCKY
jgi:hypothetical protein